MRRTTNIKVDELTKKRLKGFKRQMQVIENSDLSLGEIIERMSKGEDMLQRLRAGSVKRRNP